jgi:hypothetical protein
MGRDEVSVVDGRLKVHGIDNLRVADDSILPRVTTGNTMAPCVSRYWRKTVGRGYTNALRSRGPRRHAQVSVEDRMRPRLYQALADLLR